MSFLKIKQFLRRNLPSDLVKLLVKLNQYILPKAWDANEKVYIQKMLAYVGEGDNVLDVGANAGLWTVALAEKVGGNGCVIAFEPVKDTFQHLLKNTSVFNNVKYYNKGLSSTQGEAEIWRDPISETPPSAAIAKTADHLHDTENLIKEAIELDTLDNLFLNFNHPISFVKIDVEGHEEMVVAGGIEFFKKQKPVVFLEILREYWYPGQIGSSKTADILLKLGYSMCQVTPGEVIRSSTEFESQYENFLFLPAEEKI